MHIVNLPLKLLQYLSRAPPLLSTIRHDRVSIGCSPLQLWCRAVAEQWVYQIFSLAYPWSGMWDHYCWWSIGCWKLIMGSDIPACRQAVTASTLWKMSSSETAYVRQVTERPSQIEIPPFAEILNTRGQKLFCRSTPSACAVFFSWGCVETNGWPQYSSFLIALDYRPCITIVHDELYVLHQESKTCAAEHSNRLGAASMRNSSSFRACWAGLGKGSY